MAGLLPFIVVGDGVGGSTVCWRTDPPLTASERQETVKLSEAFATGSPPPPDSTAELARLLTELRELRADVERNRAALAVAQAPAAPASSDPQQQVEELARRAMREEGLDVGRAYRLVAREHPEVWAAARQAATLTDDLRGPTLEVD
jgi:hypothetical protein